MEPAAMELSPPRPFPHQLEREMVQLTPPWTPVSTVDRSLEISSLSTIACSDIDRELQSLEARLQARQRATREESRRDWDSSGSIKQLQLQTPSRETRPMRSSSPYEDNTSSPLKPIDRSQEAGQVADEVESALLNCQKLLSRARMVNDRPQSVSNRTADMRRLSPKPKPSALLDDVEPKSYHLDESDERLSRFIPVKPSASSSPLSSGSSTPRVSEKHWNPANHFDSPSKTDSAEHELAAKARIVRSFAERCQQDIEAEAGEIYKQQRSMQTMYVKELQRKYESKKKLSMLKLRENCERETKTLVRHTMERHEQQEQEMLAKVEAQLLQDRESMLKSITQDHEKAMTERLKRLEARIKAETATKVQLLTTQLRVEEEEKVRELEEESAKTLRDWEAEKRQDMEHAMYIRREQAVAAILKEQEAKATEIKQQLERQHHQNHDNELEKLKKALAFGAQAQMQQLRVRLDTEHEENVLEIKANAAEILDRKLTELKHVLTSAHREEKEQMELDLDKYQRISIMELHEHLQIIHESELRELKTKSDHEKEAEIDLKRRAFEQQQQKQFRAIEQMLEQELSTRLHQLEVEQDAEYEQIIENFRQQVMQNHARELEARTKRLEEAQNVLLSEAKAFLSLPDNMSLSASVSGTSEASERLHNMKKHLSKELAKYVQVLVSDFEELADEQRILMPKITESTQLYLMFKRRCEKLEGETAELKAALQTLHHQVQKKETMCKKLYQANEALMKRCQISTSSLVEPGYSAKLSQRSDMSDTHSQCSSSMA